MPFPKNPVALATLALRPSLARRLSLALGLSLVLGPALAPPLAAQAGPAPSNKAENPIMITEESVVGMWVTGDGHIRHELLPNGRYDEARGSRKSAYRGRYRLTGNHIDYVDDTGFTADGDFINGVLHHGGMIFYREKP